MGITIKRVEELSKQEAQDLGVVIPDVGEPIVFTVGRDDQVYAISVPIKTIPYAATKYLYDHYRALRANANDVHTYMDVDINAHFMWLTISGRFQPGELPFSTEREMRELLSPPQLQHLHAECYRLVFGINDSLPKQSRSFFESQAPVSQLMNNPQVVGMFMMLPEVMAKSAEFGELAGQLLQEVQELREKVEGLQKKNKSSSTTGSVSIPTSMPSSEVEG